MASQSMHEFTDANFDAEVLKSDVPTLVDLEAVLKDVAGADIDGIVLDFFSTRHCDMLSLSPDDFITVLRQAMAQVAR